MNFTDEQLKTITDRLAIAFDGVMEEKLKNVLGPMVAAETKAIVEKMRVERALYGKDRSGLTDTEKMEFAKGVKSALYGTKAHNADQDYAGGYLIPKEVASAILRIAASVGLVTSQAQQWPMGTNELGIPRYTGSFLEGEWLGYEQEGTDTSINFGSANLITKRWQLIFAVTNDLLRNSAINLADWLLALAAEAMNNAIDKQVFAGTGRPFVGILEDANVTVTTLATGKDTFAEYSIIDDSSALIGTLEESMLEGAAFYMSRTVWASLRVQKDTAGNYLLPQAGAASSGVLSMNPTGGGVKVAGEILGFPVFTCRHLPALSATAVSTKFLVFGNMKAIAYGVEEEMHIESHRSGSFGGKEIAKADMQALVYKGKFATTVALPAAFTVARTAAS